MSTAKIERRFAVILCADVVGYSRLMGDDEERTLRDLNVALRDVVHPSLVEFKGRIVRTMGDGLLIEFGSVVDAVRCAIAIQDAMQELAIKADPERRVHLRTAINVGDVITDGTSIYGDGIAVASRMESLAEPGGINVSRAVRDQVRDHLPVTFQDLGEHPVPSIARPVRVFAVAWRREENVASPSPKPDGTGPQSPAPKRSIKQPEPPAIAVLPFQNLGADAEAEFFLDSVAEDLITELSRARWFSIIARNTAFSYKDKGTDAKQISRELGVRYVLEGSLRKAGERVRISCQLVDPATGHHLWAERFDGTLENSFDLQDRITESVVGAVGPALRAAELERIGRKPTRNLDSYELTLRAIAPTFAETEKDNEVALRLVNEAIEITPGYPTANALAAWCHFQRHLLDWSSAQENDRQTAKRLARVAIDNGADVPLALALAGAVRAALTRDHRLALVAADRATMLCSNSALVLGFSALTRCISGDYDGAIAHANKAIRLSPLEPLLYHAVFALALAYLLSGRSEEAAAQAQRTIDSNPNFALAYGVLALVHAQLDHPAEFTQATGRLLAVAPRFRVGTLRRIRLADAARLQPDLDRLRAAGLPD